ncbi:hypothetical protein NQZ68_013640 [Dissostichus eleginoides]|nr:hypothetical protein NQZ68_013640 [Dissostichus eleginoides]
MQNRTKQAPRSRYTVAPGRAHSHHRPGRCDCGGLPENGGLHNRFWMLDLRTAPREKPMQS